MASAVVCSTRDCGASHFPTDVCVAAMVVGQIFEQKETKGTKKTNHECYERHEWGILLAAWLLIPLVGNGGALELEIS